jgi:hypothetical protein
MKISNRILAAHLNIYKNHTATFHVILLLILTSICNFHLVRILVDIDI